MSTNLASPSLPLPLSPSPTPSRKLPPSERDFEIYEAVHIANRSTWAQADKHQISQTRVRQIVRRVVEWLGEVLPPQTKVAREQEIHLARQIAADRFQHQLEEATTLWTHTREAKYAGLRIRLTTAQARLGVVGGILDGLAADCLEGLPVPAWQPASPAEAEAPAEPLREDDRPPEPNSESQVAIRKSWLPPARPSRQSRRRYYDQMPRELWDPLAGDELTPEIVAARAAWGQPIPPDLIKWAQEHGAHWPRPDSLPSDLRPPTSDLCCPPPPIEDFSAPNHDPAPYAPPPATAPAETPSTATACDNTAAAAAGVFPDRYAPSQPLLTTPAQIPVTVLQLIPAQPGATLSQAAPSPTPATNFDP